MNPESMFRKSILCAVLIAFALAACSQDGPQETIKIGQLASLTGFGSSWGESEVRGAALALDGAEVGGKRIVHIVEDIESDQSRTLTAYRKLVDVDGVDFIIGPTLNSFAEVVMPVAMHDGVLLITPSASFDKMPFERGPTLFSTSHSIRWMNGPIIDDMKRKNYTRIAIVHDSIPYVQRRYEFFMEDAEHENITVALDFLTDPSSKDYRTILTKIKEADVDAVYVPTGVWSNFGEFAKQARTLGLDMQFYSSQDIAIPDFFATYGKDADGVLYDWLATSPRGEEFLHLYEGAYGATPTSPSADRAYDAAALIVRALEAGASTPEEIAQHLTDLDGYEGMSGMITFDEYGQVAHYPYVLREVSG